MRILRYLGATLLALSLFAAPALAQSALTGKVTSQKEGAMEGVLVSAKRAGSNITITVVSNAEGGYSFPGAKLTPGRYAIDIRAAGYLLPEPASIEVKAHATTELNLNLREASLLELAHQLSSTEWLMSYPLTDEQKYGFRNCTGCHTMLRASMSTYNREQLEIVMQRMSQYASGSTPGNFQLNAGVEREFGRGFSTRPTAAHRREAEAVAAINLSNGVWKYPLKTIPRPKGRATQVIYTMYDLPRPFAKPHDVEIGPDGWAYYDDFGDQYMGKLDPATGEIKEYKWDVLSPGQSTGSLGLYIAKDGKVYMGNMSQKAAVIFDPATEKFEFHMQEGPGRVTMVDPSASHIDGKVWINGNDRYQVDFKTKTWTKVPAPNTGAYGLVADTKNNVYGGAREGAHIWRADARTLKVDYYPIPVKGGMRRGSTDKQDRLWWGGFDGNFVGMLDPRRSAGEQMKIYPMKQEWFMPYDAEYDNQKYAWTGSMFGDHVGRMNVETGEWDIFLLPHATNIRRIHVQEGPVSSLWVGMNHEAKIVHIEPLLP
jgi:virginiamycin B lyase